jgi:hypothetical protein
MTKVNKIHQHHLLVNISFFKLKSNWELSCQQGQEKSSYKNVLYTILDNLCWDYNIENPVDDFDFIYIFIVFELCFLLLLNIQQVTLWNPPLTVVMHGILANYLQTMFWSVFLPKGVHIVEYFESCYFSREIQISKAMDVPYIRVYVWLKHNTHDMWIWLILNNISLLDRIWSLWLVRLAHFAASFIFWLVSLIFSISINSLPDNINIVSNT